MNKSYGDITTSLIECINLRLRKYRVRWNFQPEVNEEGEDIGVSFLEEEYTHKPTLTEIKSLILGWMNDEIIKQITEGFVWKDMQIWLSSENQFNYKAAYDLAVQTNGLCLPIIFKFGTTEEPVYYTFNTLEDISDFYTSAMKHINDTLNAGWKRKDMFNFSQYEELLK